MLVLCIARQVVVCGHKVYQPDLLTAGHTVVRQTMTRKTGEKTVTIKPSGGGEEQEVKVSPGQSPREALADAMGRQSENMLLRKGEDGFLSQNGDMFAEVQDEDEVQAAANPTVGSQ